MSPTQSYVTLRTRRIVANFSNFLSTLKGADWKIVKDWYTDSLQTTSFITTHESKTDEYDIVIDQNNPFKFKMNLALYQKKTPKQVLAQFQQMKISP